MEETFAGDHREGIKHIYYPSGALWMEEDYSKGRLRADPKVYSENGDLMLAVDINPEEKGVFKVYSPTGELKNEWSYQDGKKASISKTYAKDGSVSSEWQFSEGRPDGPVKFYLAKDKLGMEMNFKKGVKEGPVKIYYPSSGALWIQAALHQDEEQGTLWVHYPRGAVLMESDFEAGQMSGPPRLHHESEWVQPAVVQQVLEGEVPANQS